jgi:hypothetical protein
MGAPRTPGISFGLFIIMASFVFILGACAKQSSAPVSQSVPPKVEESVPSPEPVQNTNELDAKEMAKLPPPKPAEIEDATRRVFKNAALLDTNHANYFLVGDFNGDRSQDIAVVIKPVSDKLSEMNQEYPPWIIADPFNPNVPPQLRKEPLQVKEDDKLLAVIHGYGPKGWRDAEATQTFLLKNAVGTDIKSQPPQASLAAYTGKKTPLLIGDTIIEVLGDKQGFLYYSGASYAWYDPKTYKPGAERRMAHSGAATKR